MIPFCNTLVLGTVFHGRKYKARGALKGKPLDRHLETF